MKALKLNSTIIHPLAEMIRTLDEKSHHKEKLKKIFIKLVILDPEVVFPLK